MAAQAARSGSGSGRRFGGGGVRRRRRLEAAQQERGREAQPEAETKEVRAMQNKGQVPRARRVARRCRHRPFLSGQGAELASSHHG